VACAILVSAALKNSRLVLAGEEHDVSTTAKCIELLNQAIYDQKGATDAEALSVEQLLLSKVGASQDVLVLSSRDV
jgi:hypothetical protein